MAARTISVIIPCRNEEGSIGQVIKGIPVGINEIIVVDNASTDRTAEIAKNAGAIVINEPKIGYGSAIKTGLRTATGDVLVVLDGDGQHPADKILELTDFLDKNALDFVSASRFPLSQPRAMSFTRIIGNQTLTLIADLLFGLHLKDLLSGMWVLKKEALRHITLKSDDMRLSDEIKIKAATNPELKFAEYHIPCSSRIGSSKLSLLKDGFLHLTHLIQLRIGLG